MSEEILTKKKCGYNKFQKLKFFHGMLLDDKDFTAEQQYHIEKRKLHNRMLHGWGVVCGLDIEWTGGANFFTVKPGMALDCQGNEILVCNEITINLTDSTCSSSSKKSSISKKKDCEEEAGKGEVENALYIGIRYQEKATAPVPVYIPGDECGKQDCASSKWKEGYCIEILEKCPEHNVSGFGLITNLMAWEEDIIKQWQESKKKDGKIRKEIINCMKKIIREYCEKPPPCPDCCHEGSYVGLGMIKLKSDKTIEEISLNECRHYLIGASLTRFKQEAICWLLSHILIDKLQFKEEMEQRFDDLEENIKKYQDLQKKNLAK